jgi:serine/threonine protein kinase
VTLDNTRFIIPSFEHVSDLKAGGFGQVFVMKERSNLGLVRAVKVLNPSPFNPGVGADARFTREAESISQLKHSSIVGYVSSGFTEDAEKKPYIVMEYVEGLELIHHARNVSFEERAALFLDILSAIHYAHQKNIIHRDLKPSNIIVRRSDNTPVIVDFGLSYLFDRIDSNTLTHTLVGTLGYIPPEVVINPANRSTAHDIYSCGILLYEIFATYLPNIQEYKPLAIIDPLLSGIDSIVQKATSPVNTRYESAQNMRGAIEAWLSVYSQLKNLPQQSSAFRHKLVGKKADMDKRKLEQENQNRQVINATASVHAMLYAAFESVMRTVSAELQNVFGHYAFRVYYQPTLPKPSSDVIELMAIENTNMTRKVAVALVWLGEAKKWNDPTELLYQSKTHRQIASAIQDLEHPLYLPAAYVIYSEGSQSPPQVLMAGFATKYSFAKEDIKYQLYCGSRMSTINTQKPSPLLTVKQAHSFISSIIEEYYSR